MDFFSYSIKNKKKKLVKITKQREKERDAWKKRLRLENFKSKILKLKINYFVTAGRGQVLLKETPKLASQRREALEREEKLSGERDTARLDLLAQLATARGQDLLQESEGSQGGLLSSLEATQSKAKEIALALEESRRSLEDVTRSVELR